MSIDWIPLNAARDIPAKERGNRGFFPSFKVSGGIVQYESCLERDIFLVFHHAPDVIKFQHQPITIQYQDKFGNERKYTPDVFVEFKEGTKGLYEIKYEEEVLSNGEKYNERWDVAKQWAEKRKIHFSILTEKNIRTARWFNIWFTLGSSKCKFLDTLIPKLNLVIPESGKRYEDICYLFAEAQGIEINKSAQVVCYAIYHGLVFVDSFSSKPLSNDTVIRKSKRAESPFKSLWEELNENIETRSNNFGDIELTMPISKKDNELGTFTSLIPDYCEEKVRNQIQIVNLWLNQPKQQRTTEWRTNFYKKWNVSERTIYYWVNAYQKEGIGGLIPKHRGVKHQSSFDPLLFDLMEKSRQYFLQPLISQKNAYEKLEKDCRDNRLEPPKFETFKTFIYRGTTAGEFARKRGNKYHKSNFTPALASYQGAFAPMQIVQMDNTSFDVFPVDSEKREGLSTPNMTAAIDCYTRMLTGFDLSFFPSSSRTVLDVLVQMILPKNKYKVMYQTEQGWPIQGFPVVLLVDNGMDYQSKPLLDFCIKYDIILEFAPIRTPRYKAFIEQWFNILHNALVQEKVSGFRPLLKQRIENPELKSEAQAVLTLQEIEQWLHRWVLDEYHFTNPYDDHSPAPYLRWQDYQNGQTTILLPLPREPPKKQDEMDLLYLFSLERIKRTLFYEGIVWEHLKYNNKALGEIYKQIGKQKVEVLLNPRDIRGIWVISPTTINPIKVELGCGWAQAIAKVHGDKPIHASAWKSDLQEIERNLKMRISPFQYQKEISRIKRDELLNRAKKITKSARKESEKMKETERKAKCSNSQVLNEDEKKIQTIITQAKSKYKPEDIDWDNLPTFWTDDFYSGE